MEGVLRDIGSWGVLRIFHEAGRLLGNHFGVFLRPILLSTFPASLIKMLYMQFLYKLHFYSPDKESRSFLTELTLNTINLSPQVFVAFGICRKFQILMNMVYVTGCQPSPRLKDQLLSPEYVTVLRDSVPRLTDQLLSPEYATVLRDSVPRLTDQLLSPSEYATILRDSVPRLTDQLLSPEYATVLKDSVPRLTDQLLSPEYATVLRDSVPRLTDQLLSPEYATVLRDSVPRLTDQLLSPSEYATVLRGSITAFFWRKLETVNPVMHLLFEAVRQASWKGKTLKAFAVGVASHIVYVVVTTGGGLSFTPETIAEMGLPAGTIFLFTGLITLLGTATTTYLILLNLVMFIWVCSPKMVILK